MVWGDGEGIRLPVEVRYVAVLNDGKWEVFVVMDQFGSVLGEVVKWLEDMWYGDEDKVWGVMFIRRNGVDKLDEFLERWYESLKSVLEVLYSGNGMEK